MYSEITPENYNEIRKSIADANSNLTAVIMREKEEKTDRILKKLTGKYKKDGDGDFAFGISFDEKIKQNELYSLMSRLPKGGDLHVHDMALLPARELVSLLVSTDDFAINADKKSFELVNLTRDKKAPEGYIPFCDAVKSGLFTEDEIVKNWTLPKDCESGVWERFEDLFAKHGALSNNPEFAEKYYERAFSYYCEKHICHVEIHMMMTEDTDINIRYLEKVREAYYKTRKKYPGFTVRIIGAGVKADGENAELSKKCFRNAVYAQKMLKDESENGEISDFIIGFDLVNEEDSSLPLKSFAPMLLKAREKYPAMNLYIHGGESLDAGNDNLIDAYLLGAKRVGHGLNLYRYPDLHARYVKSEICLEVCPISNIRLGYTSDLRNHPATEYLRTGVQMSLCSDDPAYMENETLTDDFFAATVAWDLGIADIKQLCINSLMYSGLDRKNKYASLAKFRTDWNAFIDETVEKYK